MPTRKPDMGQGSLNVFISDDEQGCVISARGGREFGEYKFIEFTRSGTHSPRTSFALIALRQRVYLEGAQDRRKWFFVALSGNQKIEMGADGDNDVYIRTQGGDDDSVAVERSRVSPELWNCLTGLASAMEADDKTYPQR